MMEHALFFLFSFIEFAAGLAFVLSLFRLDYTVYRTHIMYSAFLLTEISYLLRMGFDLKPISLVFQMIAMIVMFILMYQMPIFSAIIMGSVGYIVYGLLQMAIVVTASTGSLVSLESINMHDSYWTGYVFQSLTAAIGLLIAWLLRRTQLGFDFLPKRKKREREIMAFTADTILIFTLMAIVILTLLTFSNYLFNQTLSYILLMVILVAQILLLIYLVNRKEKRHD